MENEKAQVAILTMPDRYKTLFRKLGVATAHLPRPKILSFGCSIGDELATIRANFPDADIYGCDIDERVIAAARQSVGHLATVFHASRDAIESHGPYDIVLALSVLCLHPPPKDFQNRFPHSRFDSMVSMLDSVVKMNGYLAMKNPSYLFSSSRASLQYSVIRDYCSVLWGGLYLFDRNANYIIKGRATTSKALVQIGDTAELVDDWHVCDDLFVKNEPAVVGSMPVIDLDVPVPDFSGYPVICGWSRSNFDGLDPAVTAGCMEIREDCRWIRVPESPQPLYISTIRRQSFFGGPFIEAREQLRGAEGG